MDPQTLLPIGEVSARTGLSLRTLRHWEEVGLIHPTDRTGAGHRLYSTDDVDRIRFVMALRPLDITLQEKATLLDARDAVVGVGTGAPGPDPVALARLDHAIALAEQRSRELSSQIDDLHDLLSTLRSVADQPERTHR